MKIAIDFFYFYFIEWYNYCSIWWLYVILSCSEPNALGTSSFLSLKLPLTIHTNFVLHYIALCNLFQFIWWSNDARKLKFEPKKFSLQLVWKVIKNAKLLTFSKLFGRWFVMKFRTESKLSCQRSNGFIDLTLNIVLVRTDWYVSIPIVAES